MGPRTSGGLRQLVSSCSSYVSSVSVSPPPASISVCTATTLALSKVGEMDAVATGQRTASSGVCSLSLNRLAPVPPSTSHTFPVGLIPPMVLREDTSLLLPYSCHQSSCPSLSVLSSPILTLPSPALPSLSPPTISTGTLILSHWMTGQVTAVSGTTSPASVNTGGNNNSRFHGAVAHLPSPHDLSIPRPYSAMLTPASSPLRPHCLARERLLLWRPSHGRSPLDHQGASLPLSDEDLNRILSVLGHSLASGTRETYGSGLLAFHVFCDARGVSEDQRAPASSILLLAFLANCAGMYSGKTLENYFYGVRAWHLLHGLDWLADHAQIVLALTGASRLAPPPSKRAKRHPFTLDVLLRLHSVLDLTRPLDAAVYACLTVSFFSLARLGEVTVRSLTAFDASAHVKVSDIRYAVDRHGLQVTILHLPRTKTSAGGEDIYFASQSGVVDPTSALSHHLAINAPSPSHALFSWKHGSGLRPLTRSEFLRCLDGAFGTLQIAGLKGHGIRIGGTLEYLLRGVPFDTVKVMGRWSGDSFTRYLRQHAVIMAPYLQDSAILEPFTRYAMPPVR